MHVLFASLHVPCSHLITQHPGHKGAHPKVCILHITKLSLPREASFRRGRVKLSEWKEETGLWVS